MDRNETLDYQQVRQAYVKVMQEIELTTSSHTCTPSMVWDVLGLASLLRSTIHGTCAELEDAPTSASILYQLRHGWLDDTPLDKLETQLNERLAACLPPGLPGRRHEVAIDVTHLPYHGQPHDAQEEVRRSQAKAGTTHFHMYASLYLMRRHQRVTVAVAYWQGGQSLLALLRRLLARARQLDIQIKRLLLDRQFCTVALVRYLHQQPYQTIVAVPARGQTLKRLQASSRCSHRRSYTMRSARDGGVTFELHVVCSYLMGRYGKHGIETHLFAVLGQPWRGTAYALGKKYRTRFGIESTYRQMNRVRARTTSRDPKLRLLLVGLALLLLNLWRSLRWIYLSVPRRGGRFLDHSLFRLQRFCLFLFDAIREQHQPVRQIARPASVP